jgi:hypothetical protein
MGYHPHIPIDVENNASKKKTPITKQRIQKLIETRKQLKLKLENFYADKKTL